MIVYRYLTLEEILDFVNGRFDKIGGVYNQKNPSNSHRYKPNEKYLHFFKSLNDLGYIKNATRKNSDMLIAKFDIPFSTLIKHAGIGYYPPQGYDRDYTEVREFAVPTRKLKAEYLVSCAKDKNSLLTPETAEDALKRFERLLKEHREKQKERGED